MLNGHFNTPYPLNEPVKEYSPESPERAELQEMLKKLRSETIEVPMYIGDEDIFTSNKIRLSPPHDHQFTLGYASEGDATHVQAAIKAALSARSSWAAMHWNDRVAIFLKAADLLAGSYRAKINAVTMLGQSKNIYQAEVDAACELIDFLRFNARFYEEILQEQPMSATGSWNRMDYRPLEGFVFALTPFNFTAIAGNLPSSAAMLGNVVVWKPAYTQIYSAKVIMEVFKEAGLPDGVINLIYVDGPIAGDVIFSHPQFAGIHFTGSTGVFKKIWQTIGQNINNYRSFPRIVGETGGKDFLLAHHTADPKAVATALIRGAFEYQGQKCSAPSRAFIPKSIWNQVRDHMLSDLSSIKMGTPEDFSNFITAVIDEKLLIK